jgi:hypothetical protein
MGGPLGSFHRLPANFVVHGNAWLDSIATGASHFMEADDPIPARSGRSIFCGIATRVNGQRQKSGLRFTAMAAQVMVGEGVASLAAIPNRKQHPRLGRDLH